VANQRSRPPIEPAPELATAAPARKAAVSGNGKNAQGEESGNQDEFLFTQMDNRGQFDETDRNLFEGQDLDVPTYLRKGIKIVL